MTKRLLFCISTLLIISIPLFSQTNAKGTLILKFTGVRNSDGNIAIGINRSAEGWPRKADIELGWPKKDIKDGVFIVKIPDFPFGTYAISVLDDENTDREIEMTMGIPREGYGFSNNPPTKLSAPKFEAAAFKFEQSDTELSIELKYVAKMK